MHKKNTDYMQIWNTTITKIENSNVYPNGKIKTCFFVGANRKCIYWNKLYAKVGDNVAMKGFFNKQKVFIVESIFVIPKATNGSI